MVMLEPTTLFRFHLEDHTAIGTFKRYVLAATGSKAITSAENADSHTYSTFLFVS